MKEDLMPRFKNEERAVIFFAIQSTLKNTIDMLLSLEEAEYSLHLLKKHIEYKKEQFNND